MISNAGRVARALLLPSALFLAGGVLVPGPARAQSASSTLEGTVRTPDGAPSPGAVVEARATATGAVRGAVSGPEGRFRIDLLQPGTWEVRAHFSDGPAGEPVVVTLFLQQTAGVELVAGTALTESVTVKAEPDRLDPERVGGEVRFTQDQVDDLPIRGRVVTDLALLDASVKMTPPGGFFGETGAVFVVNGQSGRANSFLVDGLDNNDPISNTTLDAFFSQQVIKEFVVLTSQYAPEFGRASGGILNIITQQGTNTHSAQVIAQAVPGGLGSEGEFVGSLPAAEGEQQTSQAFEGGFRFGGPIRADRAFYFVSYEHDGGDTVVPFTGVGRDGVAGGIMVAPQRSDNLFLRSDFNLGDANFLMVRLSGGTRHSTGVNVAGDTTPESGFALDEGNAQLAASLTTVLSPTLLNEVRILGATSTFDQEANSSRPGVERPSGLFGGNNLNHQERNENRCQIVDDVSWQVNRHALKFGVDVTKSHTRVETAFNPNGNFLYETDLRFEPGDGGDLTQSDVAMYGDNPIPNPGQPNFDDDGDGLIDEDGLIKTYPVVFQLIEGNPSAIIDDTRVALFSQDTWEAGDRLVLNYGLRYDLSTFHLPAETRVPSSIPNGGATPDRNNVSPRVGFTWKPRRDNSLLVRGGAGMFYDKLVLGFPAVAAITSGTNIGLIFPQGLTLEITEDVVEQVGIDAIKEGLIFPPELVLRFSTGTTLDTPYTNQFSLGMEAEAGEHGTVRGRVTRALGYHQTLMRDLNPVVDSTTQGFPIHRDQTVGSIAAIVSEGRSWYTGLDLGWRYHSGRKWIDVSYSLSKALDLGPDPLKGGISIPPDSDDLAGEKARSDSDQRHRFVVSGALPLPWGGVWASGQAQISSGAPFNVTTGKDENLDGLTNDRPPGVQRNTGADTPLGPVNELRAAEGLPPVHSLSEPVFWQMDLRVWKPFAFHDQRGKGDVFLQVFNLFDRFNPGPIEGRATSSAFGEPTGQVGLPRTVEVGFRLGF